MINPMQKTQRSAINDSRNMLNELIELGLIMPLNLALSGLSRFSNSIQDFQKTNVCASNKSCTCSCCDMDQLNLSNCCNAAKRTTDLSVQARMGEVRVRRFVVENNLNKDVEINIEVSHLIDAYGKSIDNTQGLISVSPQKQLIRACECQNVEVIIKLEKPLSASNTYFTEIRLKGGCEPDPVTLSICIEPDEEADHFVLYNRCKPQKGRFVVFEDCCNCGCSQSVGERSKTRHYYSSDSTKFG